MPAELITRYEDEYLRLVDHVRASFEHPADDTHIEEDLSSAERLLDLLEIEALSVENEARTDLIKRLSIYKDDMEKLSEHAKKRGKQRHATQQALSAHVAAPNELEAGLCGPHDRLLGDYTAPMATATDSIDRTHRMALEAEQLGASVLEDLRRQREQIRIASRHLQDTDQDLDRSNRILRDMLRRLAASRMASSIILFLLVLAILFVLYHKLFS